MNNESRFRVVQQMNPERYQMLQASAQREISSRFSIYEQLATLSFSKGGDPGAAKKAE